MKRLLGHIPLVTSIPPFFSRLDNAGNEAGGAWLTACVQSWLDEGFDPITVNSSAETMLDFALPPRFEKLKTTRDGFEEFGKRYVSLGDMIQLVVQKTEGPIEIINSDIALELTEEARQRIRTLQPGTCIICNRIDVDTLACENGVVYSSGYDFFVFHASDLRKVSENRMYFGLPWWDHYLPISVLSQRVTRLKSEGIKAYHLKHDGRWKRRLWRKLGHRFVGDIRALGDAADPTYLSGLSASVKQPKKRKGGSLSSLLNFVIRKPNFYAVSDFNVECIDRAYSKATDL